MQSKHSIDMLDGPIASKLLIFAIPLMLSGILQLLYNAADVAVVGQFCGKESLAAVGSTSSLINLFVNLFIGISIGVCVTLANAIGMKDAERAHNTVHTAITVSLISGIIVGIIGFFFTPKILRLMQSPDDVIDKASLYLKIYFCGVPANLVYNFGSSILRAMGDTKRPMIILTIAGIINVIFNLIFVIIFKMDVAGVATATIISQIISAICIIVILMRSDDICHFEFRKMRIYKAELKNILKVGVPAGIQSSIFSLSNIQIQTAVNSFGSATVAGNAAASNLEGFIYTSMNAIYQAAMTFVSQNYGAHRVKRIKRITINSLILVTGIGVIMGMATIFMSDSLLRVYSTESEVIAFGKIRISFICSAYFLCGVMEVLSGVLRGLNRSLLPMLASVIGVCGIRMIWVTFVFPMFHSLDALYISYPISWLMTALFHAICLMIIFKRGVYSDNKGL